MELPNDHTKWLWLAGIIMLHIAALTIAVMHRNANIQSVTSPILIGTLIAAPTITPALSNPKQQKTIPSKNTSSITPPIDPTPSEPSRTTPATMHEEVASAHPLINSAPPSPITPPRIDASQLNNPAPPYPPLSRHMGEQGRVLLDVYILPNGTVGEIKLKRSSGFNRLDKAALETVQKWRYIPAHQGNEPIPYWYVQPIAFSLDN